jgi:hypothetical protein
LQMNGTDRAPVIADCPAPELSGLTGADGFHMVADCSPLRCVLAFVFVD